MGDVEGGPGGASSGRSCCQGVLGIRLIFARREGNYVVERSYIFA